MKKHSLKIVILTIVLIICVIVLNTWLDQEKTTQREAVNGVLDLRGYDFSQGEPVELDGEWAFVPGQLLDSIEFEKVPSYFVQVPSLWTSYDLDGENVPKYTSGTYRLKIKIDHKEEILGLKTSNIRMSNAMYLDGQLIGQSGSPAEDASYTPHNIPYVSYFISDNREIELLIHVANFEYASGGGILGSIYIGDQDSIGKLRESSIVYDWVTIAAFLTMFIYFLGSYLHARIGLEQLYFSLFCFSNVLYAFSHGEKVFLALFPATPYELFERVQSSSSILIGFFILLYFQHALKPFTHRRIFRTLSIMGLLLFGSALLPVHINSQLQGVYSAYIFIVLVYIIYIQVIAIYKRSVGATYLILSSFTIFIYFIVGTLNVMMDIKLNALPPLLPFICLTLLALFISHRFTKSFLKKDELSSALLHVDQLKNEFIAKTSHEFRTPLHGIIAISQSMLDKEDASLTNDQKEKMMLVVHIAQRLSLLVNDILDFSKLKVGELKLNIAPVDLFATTHVVVETFSYLIDKDVTIINHMKRGQFVLADEERIRQILYNLIENAIKYTHQGKIEINCFERDGKVVIQISDTGIGIPPENMEKLYDPFQQFENSVGGTGLGLSVTKELVQIQNGEITVDSIVGKGTTFTITLPRADVKEGEEKRENPMYVSQRRPIHLSIPYIAKNKGKQKVIIADDDHINLKVLIDTLTQEGYFIIAVDSGKAVFDQIKKHPDVDLVILDIMMPGLSGYEVCQQLRKAYPLSELPVLMLTAAIRGEDMVAAFRSGANDFLHKPLDASELKTRIRNLILMKESAEAATNMEVAFLQAQIKPHFIYNVLNSILSLSYLDLDKARTMITDFAHFLRGSFSFENTSSLVPLAKELSLIQSYVNIQMTRFPEQMEFELQMEEPIHCFIPPLLLQPLVENAIIHGLKEKKAGGKVTLKVKEENGMVVCQVIDNGRGISAERLHDHRKDVHLMEQGVGLHNIAKRLKYYEEASIHFESEENKGTTVEVKFPFIHDMNSLG
ncbi:sensor histidine kinase YesM [Cytobacillus eiseniae]|uniref:histidine kinase n=1 Tax=Cytobacillus eiseniae TaxID=762947 RepID=A0ABS4RIQ6_9BACI|nr:ATP-binding protein [Cytobacillus eiseniae]MBP2242235.1 sensor histidine kinase YesM [Cytobacillus eiseniae]